MTATSVNLLRRIVLGRRRAAGRDQGAILVLAAVGFVLAIVAAALAVDLGRVAAQARDNQAVADLAALDAVRNPLDAQVLALASATRNGFLVGGGQSLVTEVGTVDAANNFVPGGGIDAVRVTVTSPMGNMFAAGSNDVARVAVATNQAFAGFSIGSALGTVDTSEAPLLNRLMERFLGGSVGSVGLVSYQGLANAFVNLGRLGVELGLGSVDELLTANLTLAQLLTATSTVLANDGVAAAADVNSLAAVVTNTAVIQLGNFVSVDQGALGRAAGVDVNVLQLISAAGALANQSSFMNLGSAITVPGATSTTLGVTVVESPRTYFGPVGGSVDTAQVDMTTTSTIDTGLGGLLRLVGDVPVNFSVASATGTLTDIACTGPPPGITVAVDGQPVSTSLSTTLTVTSLGLPVALATVGPVSATGLPSSSSMDFDYPTEFSPSAPSKTTPGATPGLSLSSGNINITLLGLLPLGVTVSSLIADILAVLNPLLDDLVSTVTSPVVTRAFNAAGVSVGPVDTAALAEDFDPATCGQPRLVG